MSAMELALEAEAVMNESSKYLRRLGTRSEITQKVIEVLPETP